MFFFSFGVVFRKLFLRTHFPTQNNQYQDPILTEDHNSACKTKKRKQLTCDTYCCCCSSNTISNIIYYKYQGLCRRKKTFSCGATTANVKITKHTGLPAVLIRNVLSALCVKLRRLRLRLKPKDYFSLKGKKNLMVSLFFLLSIQCLQFHQNKKSSLKQSSKCDEKNLRKNPQSYKQMI